MLRTGAAMEEGEGGVGVYTQRETCRGRFNSSGDSDAAREEPLGGLTLGWETTT